MTWTLILKDGSRHEVDARIRFEVIGGSKLIAPSSIDGDPAALADALTEGGAILESENGHQHKVAVELIKGQWRVTGLGD